MQTQIGETFEAMQRHVGRLLHETPDADPRFLAFAFIAAEIDKINQRLDNMCPQRDIMD